MVVLQALAHGREQTYTFIDALGLSVSVLACMSAAVL